MVEQTGTQHDHRRRGGTADRGVLADDRGIRHKRHDRTGGHLSGTPHTAHPTNSSNPARIAILPPEMAIT
jgi:hypothetical protein